MPVERPPRGHSCVRCKKRKIKCDGSQPCSACSRSQATCLSRPPAMPRRRRVISTPSQTVENPDNSSAPEFMLQDEGNPRYVNDPLWGDLSKELPLESTLGQISEPETPYGTSSILWGLSDYRSLRSYHPGSGRTLQLWQIFLDNVHPLSKVLHTLSIQRQIIAATLNLDGVSRGLEALMFVIYLSAVNSLKPSECESILGERRDILHKRYLSATKQAFVNCECLKSCSFIVLQSLTLYLLCMRQYHDHKSSWLLTGLAVRSAQRMGLHKGNMPSRIPSFEAEMRRRLWWQILLLDSRAAQLSGLSVDFQTRTYFDSRRPLNVNDSDLYPEMNVLPPDVESHATEMIFCLVIYEGARFINSQALSECTDEKVVDEFILFLRSKFLRFCDNEIPVHLLTHHVTQSVIAQTSIKGLQARKRNNKLNLTRPERETLLGWNIDVIECMNSIYSTKSLQSYLWFLHGTFPFEPFVYVLLELQRSVDGPLIDRGWNAIDGVYNTFVGTDWLPCTHSIDSLYCAVGTLALKAWETQSTRREPTPSWVSQLREKQRGDNNVNPQKEHSHTIDTDEATQWSRFVGNDEDIIGDLDIDWAYWTQSLEGKQNFW